MLFLLPFPHCFRLQVDIFYQELISVRACGVGCKSMIISSVTFAPANGPRLFSPDDLTAAIQITNSGEVLVCGFS